MDQEPVPEPEQLEQPVEVTEEKSQEQWCRHLGWGS
jgi:hypothetical protein